MVDGGCWKERAMSFLLVMLTYATSSYLFLFSEMQPLPVVCFALFEGSGKIIVQTSSYTVCQMNRLD